MTAAPLSATNKTRESLNLVKILAEQNVRPHLSNSDATLCWFTSGLEKNVWVDFVKIALEYQPLNLGQGLPDDLVPEYVVQSLGDVVKDVSLYS